MVKQLFDSENDLPKRGRPKYSVRTPQGMIERFLKRNISPTNLQKLFDKLTVSQQAEFIIQVMPYIVAKKTPDSISASEVDKLYEKLEQTLNGKTG